MMLSGVKGEGRETAQSYMYVVSHFEFESR